MADKPINIAIDGPSGAGKSTLAKSLAERFGFIYVDTGAIYRTVGLYADENAIMPDDEETLKAHFDKIKIELKWVDNNQRIFLSGRDVSDEIRTPKASMYASAVSALPAVRGFLLEMQRSIARTNNVIMDGRDIGTVILPDADVKIFMTADIRTRAERRYKELLEKGRDTTFNEVLQSMITRDSNDSSRKSAPCIPAKDAIILDNSGMDLTETVNAASRIIEDKLHKSISR